MFVAAAITYIATTSMAWGLLVARWDPSPRWTQVANPLKWGELKQVQSEQFFRQGMRSFSQGKPSEAVLSLQVAAQRNPQHYAARLIQAQVTMAQGSFEAADDAFRLLLHAFPSERSNTSIAFHDALVMSGQTHKVAAFALDQAARDTSMAYVWMQSVFVMARAPYVASLLASNDAALANLPPQAQSLLRSYALAARGDIESAVNEVKTPFPAETHRLLLVQQIRQLADIGAFNEARRALSFHARHIGPLEEFLAEFHIEARAGDNHAALIALRLALTIRLNADNVERIATALVRTPVPGAFRDLHQRVLPDGSLRGSVDAAGMWAVALACAAGEEAEEWRVIAAQRRPPLPLPALERIDLAEFSPMHPESVLRVVNGVQLPRDIAMALLRDRHTPAEKLPRQRNSGRSQF